MDPMTALAASGLRARMESLDLLANNIANAGTGGYKADREFYSLYTAPEAAGDDPLQAMPLIESHWTDHAQGALHATGNPLDVALDGKGFFAVNGPGGPLYTRNGNFRLAPDGRLTTQEGYPVRATGGAPLVLDAPHRNRGQRNGLAGRQSRRATRTSGLPHHRRPRQTGSQLLPRLRPQSPARARHCSHHRPRPTRRL
jgi:flagellar hook-basal body protein